MKQTLHYKLGRLSISGEVSDRTIFPSAHSHGLPPALMLVLILSLSRPLVVRLRFGFLLPPGVLPLLSCSAPFSFSVPLRLSSQLFADPRIGPLFILKTEPPVSFRTQTFFPCLTCLTLVVYALP